jgi:Putative adhesin
MRARHPRPTLAFVVVLMASGSVAAAAAVHFHSAGGDGGCEERGGGPNAVCEVRELTLPAGQPVRVDARPNGGIKVEGGSRSDVLVKATVMASAETEEAARALLAQVQLSTSGGVHADGPRPVRERNWWVSYELRVPAHTDLALESMNGGISIDSVSGDLEFKTMNGGIHLTDTGGRVHGRTTNGGLDIRLEGTGWDGEMLDVQTTNGGVNMAVPASYNAHLETATVNGGMRIDFPVRVQGRLDRQLSVDLGSGGPTVRATTTNGGVVIRKR